MNVATTFTEETFKRSLQKAISIVYDNVSSWRHPEVVEVRQFGIDIPKITIYYSPVIHTKCQGCHSHRWQFLLKMFDIDVHLEEL